MGCRSVDEAGLGESPVNPERTPDAAPARRAATDALSIDSSDARPTDSSDGRIDADARSDVRSDARAGRPRRRPRLRRPAVRLQGSGQSRPGRVREPGRRRGELRRLRPGLPRGCRVHDGQVCLLVRGRGVRRHLCRPERRTPATAGPAGGRAPAGQVCVAGTCLVTCQEGQTVCGGTCVNLRSDSDNCGACGHDCKGTRECVAGECVRPRR